MDGDDDSEQNDPYLTDEEVALLFPEKARPSLRTIQRYRLEHGLDHYMFKRCPVTKRSDAIAFIECHLKVGQNRSRKRRR